MVNRTPILRAGVIVRNFPKITEPKVAARQPKKERAATTPLNFKTIMIPNKSAPNGFRYCGIFNRKLQFGNTSEKRFSSTLSTSRTKHSATAVSKLYDYVTCAKIMFSR